MISTRPYVRPPARKIVAKIKRRVIESVTGPVKAQNVGPEVEMEVQPARYVAIPVSCSACHEDQFVHIHARTGIVQMNPQAIECVKCHAIFDVMVPDEIIAGPFPV